MFNSTAINRSNFNQTIGNIVNDIYFSPGWEKISSFVISEKNFFFFSKSYNVDLLRKFALKRMLEKYIIRTFDSKVIAEMDLKLYKDCIYIVNLEINIKKNAAAAIEKFLKISFEKALNETTEKKVLVNILPKQKYRSIIKKLLIKNGFEIEANQSEYEKQMFGEIYGINIKTQLYRPLPVKAEPVLLKR